MLRSTWRGLETWHGRDISGGVGAPALDPLRPILLGRLSALPTPSFPADALSLLSIRTYNRRLQPLRYLHDCSDCFRLERLPGGACTHWKAPPLHGARQNRTSIALAGIRPQPCAQPVLLFCPESLGDPVATSLRRS